MGRTEVKRRKKRNNLEKTRERMINREENSDILVQKGMRWKSGGKKEEDERENERKGRKKSDILIQNNYDDWQADYIFLISIWT